MSQVGTDGIFRCDWAYEHPLLLAYHDEEYGIPIHDDNLLFERLVLEQMQAGLSWLTVLKKRHYLREAMDQFQVSIVAHYDDQKLVQLLSNANLIRNRKKLVSAIEVAKRINQWHLQGYSFDQWLKENGSRITELEEWVTLFKQTFVFVGYEIVKEFLLSIGILEYPHQPKCFLVHRKVNFFERN
ncbi:MAG: DNA-3-methyladenine glycosylase I [bacterium]|nr:DNA-3-methyladenine glycosylase I [bacterium]